MTASVLYFGQEDNDIEPCRFSLETRIMDQIWDKKVVNLSYAVAYFEVASLMKKFRFNSVGDW